MHCRVLTVALALAVLGCATGIEAQTPTRVMGAEYHNPSRAFIDMMIPHHETAIMMSNHHQAMSTNEAVKAFARRMAGEQQREIAELKEARRVLFGSDSARAPMMGGMMQMMGMRHGHDTSAARARMDMTSASHDRMFLEHMIAHHRDGADVAVLAEDSRAAVRVKQLARKIREGQERDIAEMRRLLDALPAAPAGHRH